MNEMTLPYFLEVKGKRFNIRNNGDFRVLLDVLAVNGDNDLNDFEKQICINFILFGEKANEFMELGEEGFEEIKKFINCGKNVQKNPLDDEDRNKQPIIDWNYDFGMMCPALNKVVGYDIRTPEKFTHWWTVCGALSVIEECTFSVIIRIRRKLAKGKRLDKDEQEFYHRNPELINIKHLNEGDIEFLDSGG